jgi:hypothetical protein
VKPDDPECSPVGPVSVADAQEVGPVRRPPYLGRGWCILLAHAREGFFGLVNRNSQSCTSLLYIGVSGFVKGMLRVCRFLPASPSASLAGLLVPGARKCILFRATGKVMQGTDLPDSHIRVGGWPSWGCFGAPRHGPTSSSTFHCYPSTCSPTTLADEEGKGDRCVLLATPGCLRPFTNICT